MTGELQPSAEDSTGEKDHATRTNCSGRISDQGADVPDAPAAIERATASSGHP